MIDLRLIDGESEACTVVAMRSTRSNEQPRGNEGRLDGVVQHQRSCRGERKMGANEKREECGSIGNVRARKRCSRGAQDQQRQEHGVP